MDDGQIVISFVNGGESSDGSCSALFSTAGGLYWMAGDAELASPTDIFVRRVEEEVKGGMWQVPVGWDGPRVKQQILAYLAQVRARGQMTLNIRNFEARKDEKRRKRYMRRSLV